MTLRFRNSISGLKEDFVPLDAEKIKMYVCGPTVYDLIHLGNARPLVVYDVLYRLLRKIYGPDKVLYVRNITDVDDKINQKAIEQKISIFELTKQTIAQFSEDALYLNCLTPNIEPKATDHIAQMIAMIQRLLQHNNAYVQDGSVYFDVTSFADYGKLSGRLLQDLIAGARVQVDGNKRHPGDFLLWKPALGPLDPSSVFPSPWGPGMPGWHIECSSMAHAYLGENFDIHGGGVDLLFPHHTNEVAQSCCAFPGSRFANYWIHNGFLRVEGEKMSKSLGNFITVADLKEQKISSSTIRYVLLNTSYHKPMDFTQDTLRQASANIDYLQRAIKGASPCDHAQITEEFFSHLQDDLNTPSALNYLLSVAKQANKTNQNSLREAIKYCCDFLGMLHEERIVDDTKKAKIQELINQRSLAKSKKDWALADQIRQQLMQMGITLEDNPDGSVSWHQV